MFDQYDIDRFWEKVRKRRNGCWEWIYGKSHNYGMFGYKGKMYRAHIFSFMITNNIILRNSDILILHTCNNRACVNPEHLYDGTAKENAQDAIKMGTFSSLHQDGENNPNTKITEEDVRKIRQLGLWLTCSEISRRPEFVGRIGRFGISLIIRKETWKHIK